jgi:HAD superfamily hydrolase (TIGR01549 family)
VVVFDCDGVLFDTAHANRMYYDRLLKQFDRPAMTEAQFNYAQMHTVHETLHYLFEDKEIIAAVNQYRESMDYDEFLNYLQMEPVLPDLLARLRMNYKTAIATNRTDTMHRLLDRFDLAGSFDLVVTSADVEYPKPHPAALLKILSAFKVIAQQAIYIGDSSVDAQAAKAADVPFVAFCNVDLSAHYHIQSLNELDDILEV